MKHSLKISMLILSALVIAFLSTCKKDSNDDNNENPPVEWVTGTKTTLEINASPGEEVAETVNALTFMFPEGGVGSLEVAPVVQGVANPLGGKSYYINYTGSGLITVIITEVDSSVAQIHGFGTGAALSADITYPENIWYSIPFDSIAPGKKAFYLKMPEDLKSGKGPKAGFNFYNLSILSQGSEQLEWFYALVKDCKALINYYISQMKSPLKDTVQERMNELDWSVTTSFSPSYEPYYYKDKNIITNRIYVDTYRGLAVAKSDLAHETGHYIMHLMVGTNQYYALKNQLPLNTSKHGIGTIADRQLYMIEESAYFSEYMNNGGIGSYTQNPEEPRPMFKATYNMPDVTDYVGIEGFGIVMLAGLHRTGTLIQDVHAPYNTTRYIDFPVIGAPFPDIIDIIAKGAANQNELRSQIEQYLIDNGKGYLAVPFFHRLGWGYHNVKMTIVDPQGNKLSNISARSICIADGKTWYGPKMTTVSGDDGKYTLKGVFGGSGTENGAINKIRFYRGTTDSADVAAPAIDWAKGTHELIDWGIIGVDLENDLPPYLENKDYGIYVGYATLQCGDLPSGTTYIPEGIANGVNEDEYIVCHSNGAGTITIDWSKTDTWGNVETCTGSGTVLPHHIVPGIFDTYYYAMNINFTYTYTHSNGTSSHQYVGTVTGIDKLDKYMTSDAICSGIMTVNWIDANEDPQTCSTNLSFGNFFIHDYPVK